MVPTEPEKDKELWREAKQKQEEDSLGTFLFRVRGLPCKSRIYKTKKNKGGTKKEETKKTDET